MTENCSAEIRLAKVSTFQWNSTLMTSTAMEISQLRISRLLKSLLFLLTFDLIAPVSAVYFYIENASPKCFYEELPKDTIVVGQSFTPVYN